MTIHSLSFFVGSRKVRNLTTEGKRIHRGDAENAERFSLSSRRARLRAKVN